MSCHCESVTARTTYHTFFSAQQLCLFSQLCELLHYAYGPSIIVLALEYHLPVSFEGDESDAFSSDVSGNNKLGGQDFNQRLMLYLYDQLHQKYGSLPTRKEEIHHLRQAVEAVKLNLTVHEAATLRVLLTVPVRELTKGLPESEVRTNTLLKGKPSQKTKDLQNLGGSSKLEDNSAQVVFETEISRKLFETLNEDLFEKILVPIEQVLKEGHLHKAEVDEIVLVGGSTRIPRIRRVIRDFFGKEPNTSVDPDLAVVTGVAIQAGIVGGSWPLQVSAIEIPNKHLQKTNFN